MKKENSGANWKEQNLYSCARVIYGKKKKLSRQKYNELRKHIPVLFPYNVGFETL